MALAAGAPLVRPWSSRRQLTSSESRMIWPGQARRPRGAMAPWPGAGGRFQVQVSTEPRRPGAGGPAGLGACGRSESAIRPVGFRVWPGPGRASFFFSAGATGMRPKRKALESTLESQQIDRRPTGGLGAAAGRHYRPPGYWQ